MKLTLQGAEITLHGKLPNLGARRALRSTLEALGARRADTTLRETTTLLVVDDMARGSDSAKAMTARALDIPIIEEAELASLIQGEELELDDARAALRVRSVGELIAEARSALGGEATSEAWSKLIALVDACPTGGLDEFVSYLEPQVSRWHVGRTTRWSPEGSGPHARPGLADFARSAPEGVLRLAPPTWLTRASHGHESGLRLCDALSLRQCPTLTRDGLLTHPDTSNIRWLDLGDESMSPKRWARWANGPIGRRLETLRLGGLADRDMPSPDLPDLERLRRLELFAAHHYARRSALDRRALGALMRTPALARVETLTFMNYEHTKIVSKLLGDGDVLPSLRRIEDDCTDGVASTSMMWRKPALIERIEEFAVTTRHDLDASIRRLSKMNARGLTELDLTGFLTVSAYEPDEQKRVTGLRERALRHLPGSRLTGSIERLRLGDHMWSPELADALEGQVELIHDPRPRLPLPCANDYR